MDSHFESIPGLGTLTAGGLSGGDLEDLGGDADGALGLVLLVLGSHDDLGAGVFQRLHISALQSQSTSKSEAYLIFLISSWVSSPLVFSFS